MTDPANLSRLLAVMARLRDPVAGCPWDREQSFATIAPYTIEEAYEVADAIAVGDVAAIRDELGDLLLQVVFHARIAEEAGHFAFDDVAAAIADKMERRHPHIFDPEYDAGRDGAPAWEAQKAAERAARAAGAASALDGVAVALPALTRAEKIQKRAARVGFDWPDAAPAAEKVREELSEVLAETEADRIEDEVGDLLFAVVNLARKLGTDPEAALRRATRKFESRFRRVEAALVADGRDPAQTDLAAWDALWERIKREDRSPRAD